MYSVSRVLYHHRTQGKAVEGVHIRGVIDALRARGTVVDIISLPGADPYAAPAAMSPTRQATPFMRFVAKLPQPAFELAELAYNLVAAFRVNLYLRRNRDTEFIYERYSLFMFAPLLVAKIRGVPMLLEVNDSATVERVRPVFFLFLARAIERWVFRNATGLVVVSQTFLDYLSEAHGRIAPAIVTPNAANLADFSFTPEQRDTVRSRYGLTGSVVCGYLGAFVPWHAIDKFVYAIAAHLEATPHLKLLLVGDGATFGPVENFVATRKLNHQIVLTGRVPHAEVPGLLAAMDMAILPSAGDYTSPVKLFEFMACGIAPVAPDLAPIKEVLREGETGWMFTAYDLDAAVRSVMQHAGNPPQLRAVGAAARSYVGAHRQWANNIEQLLQFHRDLISRGNE
ncbi:MAG: glycosyltransferase [Pseudomonadota bacterium]